MTMETSIDLPLDSDGFLRRACPSCVREFKWLPSAEDAAEPAPAEYFCPYCGGQSASGEWLTEAQSGFIEEEVLEQVLGPSLKELQDSIEGLGRGSGGLISITGHMEVPERTHAKPVFEPDDMKRVDFACHPSEPLKVDEAWTAPIHCLYCGRTDGASTR